MKITARRSSNLKSLVRRNTKVIGSQPSMPDFDDEEDLVSKFNQDQKENMTNLIMKIKKQLEEEESEPLRRAYSLLEPYVWQSMRQELHDFEVMKIYDHYMGEYNYNEVLESVQHSQMRHEW